jgi:hypothetical protein
VLLLIGFYLFEYFVKSSNFFRVILILLSGLHILLTGVLHGPVLAQELALLALLLQLFILYILRLLGSPLVEIWIVHQVKQLLRVHDLNALPFWRFHRIQFWHTLHRGRLLNLVIRLAR